MNLTAYQQAAIRTAKWFPSLAENLAHAALGLITELGEFATVVKRVEIYGKEMTSEMLFHAEEELGDTYWYVALGCEALKCQLQDQVNKNQLTGKFFELDIKNTLLLLANCVGTIAGCKICEDDNSQDMPKLFGIAAELLDQCCIKLGLNPENVRSNNISKLKLRFPDKFSNEAAEARTDKGGADARNS